MLDIKSMSDEDKLFNFILRLQPWPQSKLWKQAVRDLSMAIIAIDSLVDFRFMNTSPSEFKKSKDCKKENS